MIAAFRSSLEVRKVSHTDWMLLQDLAYYSPLLGCSIIVPVGFRTDFASVPRLPLAWWLVGGSAQSAAVVHDYLYQGHLALTRRQADAVFYEAMGARGGWPEPLWRRWLAWAGTRVGGWVAWHRRVERTERLNPRGWSWRAAP